MIDTWMREGIDLDSASCCGRKNLRGTFKLEKGGGRYLASRNRSFVTPQTGIGPVKEGEEQSPGGSGAGVERGGEEAIQGQNEIKGRTSGCSCNGMIIPFARH